MIPAAAETMGEAPLELVVQRLIHTALVGSYSGGLVFAGEVRATWPGGPFWMSES